MNNTTYRIDLSFLIKIPDILAPVCDCITQDFADGGPHVIVSRRKDDDVCFKSAAVFQDQTALIEPGDSLGTTLDFDLAVGDERAASDVNVVASASGHICAGDAGAVYAEVELETCLLEALQYISFCSVCSLCEVDGECELDWVW